MELDLRGLPCPEPVMETKKALNTMEKGLLVVLVDNQAAFANVQKLAKGLGCQVEGRKNEEIYRISIIKGEAILLETATTSAGFVLLLATETMGTGDPLLGKKLLQAYLYTLTENATKPEKILLLNGGVKNALPTADTCKNLRILEQQGTEILVCGTCLDFYGLQDSYCVGRISNMFEIGEEMVRAARFVSFT